MWSQAGDRECGWWRTYLPWVASLRDAGGRRMTVTHHIAPSAYVVLLRVSPLRGDSLDTSNSLLIGLRSHSPNSYNSPFKTVYPTFPGQWTQWEKWVILWENGVLLWVDFCLFGESALYCRTGRALRRFCHGAKRATESSLTY